MSQCGLQEKDFPELSNLEAVFTDEIRPASVLLVGRPLPLVVAAELMVRSALETALNPKGRELDLTVKLEVLPGPKCEELLLLGLTLLLPQVTDFAGG